MRRLAETAQTHTYYILGILVLTIAFYSLVFNHFSTLDRSRLSTETEYFFPVVPSDSSDYARLADNLIENQTFSTDQTAPYTPEIHWPIGYPGFLAITKFISGDFVLAAVVQTALSALSAVLIFLIVVRFVPPYIAVLPSIIFTLDPSITYYNISIHSDGFFTSLIFILVYALLVLGSEKTLRPYVFFILGAFLGFTTLVRPIAQFLVIVLPILFIVLAYTHYTKKQLAVRIGIFTLGFLILISPWMVRNYYVADSLMLADVGPKNLLLYNVKDYLVAQEIDKNRSLAELEGIGYADSSENKVVLARLKDELQAKIDTEGGTPLTHYSSLALGYIFADPIGYTKFHLANTLPYFFAGSIRHYLVSVEGPFKKRAGLAFTPHTNISHHLSTLVLHGDVTKIISSLASLSYVLLEIAWRGALILLGLLALLIKGREQKLFMLSLWLLVLYFAILTGPVSLTRYRIVSDPYLLILATIGATVGYAYLQRLLCHFKEKHYFKKFS